jgi:acetyl esterase/lipase
MTSVRKRDGVVYRETPEADLLADVYLPGGTSQSAAEGRRTEEGRPDAGRPAVLLMHGGGWENDHHGMLEPHLTRLAEQGYVGAEVTYRRSGQATYPAAIEDVAYAVRWLKRERDEFGIDPDRVAIGGHSAGGHLAALCAVWSGDASFAPDDSDFVPEDADSRSDCALDESTEVAAAIPINGLFNLEKLGQMHPSRLFVSGFIRRFFGAEYLKRRDAYREASCVTHIDGDEPPFLVLAGTHDQEVPPYESVQLCDQLEHAGGDPELLLAEGGDHFCFMEDGSYYEEGMTRIEAFLDEVL